ncbi:DUF4190 domain-containing protein [Emticicia sp. 17c]|uniref:DUF4190 domain-containing protein n=1 Tax=Emticicia sp. 17c TaxID=3127704 RepID=UPI00301BC518
MKHSLLALVSVCLLSLMSCQKKQYAYFQNSAQPQYAHNVKKAPVNAADTKEIQATETEIALPSAPAETFSASSTEAITTETVTTVAVAEKTEKSDSKTVTPQVEAKKKLTFKQKVQAVKQLRKLSKLAKKANATNAANPKGNSDTLAIISLIAGILGLIVLFLLPLAGILLGVLALVFGGVSVGRTNKRGFAIAGIILGALLVLFGLIVVIFIAAFFAAIV